MVHTIFAAIFIVGFAVSLGLFAAGAALKSRQLLTWGARGFLLVFASLSVLYLSGFALKAQFAGVSSDLVLRAVDKHHRMSKFVWTGCMLITAACAVVLYRFRQEPEYPVWFRANILFISLTLLVFVLRSLLTGFAIEWAKQKSVSAPVS